MARVTPGALVGSVTGTVGGLVFRGAGARAGVSLRPSVSRTRSVAQQERGALFSALAAEWPQLDPEARACWQEFARQALPPAGATGRAPTSARAAFFQWRLNLATCGVTPNYTWPSVWPYFPPATFAITAALSGGASFTLYEQGFGLTAGLALYVAPCTQTAALPSRPAWRPLFLGSRDGLPTWDDLSPDPDWTASTDLSAYFAANVPEARAGQTWAARIAWAIVDGFGTPTTLTTFTIA